MSVYIFLLAFLAVQCQGHEFRFHTFVDSHMILQREPMKSRIWGWSAPHANITATLNDIKDIAFSIADCCGSWSIDLPPQPAGSGHQITVTDGSSTLTLEDIAFGDVYLCSGQSNMEMSVQGAFDADVEIEDSINYPDLRLATVKRATSDTPERDVPSKAENYTWSRSSPGAFGSSSFSYFSATCYFFGRELYKSMGGSVPVGLVTSCWGGQKVELFSSPDALADETCGGIASAYQKLDTVTMEQDNTIAVEANDIGDSTLWNAMIHPLLPMRFTGALWYQGEANSHNATSYACRFPAMITDWRRKFNLPNLSFFYVELAAYDREDYKLIRSAQGAALKLDQVGYVTAIDLGDPTSPEGPIHPRRKQEVGRRLSLSVRAIQYKEENLVYQGPRVLSFQGAISTLFFFPNTSQGLHLNGSAACTTCCSELPFHVLGSEGNWTRVSGATVQSPNKLVFETPVKDILGIRYAWEAYPQCILYNGIGGPDDHTGIAAAPFELCFNPSGLGPWTGQGCKNTFPLDHVVSDI